jgi:ferredoxin
MLDMAKKITTYKAGNLTIIIDRSKCISCGACTFTASKTFELDAENMAVVKAVGPYDLPSVIKEAGDNCVAQAIEIKSSK